MFGNAVYASRITSECRRQILDAIATHPGGMAHVAMVATDGVYFVTPHPKLSIGAELGEWDHTTRRNLTLFKPGVYWDDSTRKSISEGRSPHFKARGFKASDFADSILRIDREFAVWDNNASLVGAQWPRVTFTPAFAMVTALQALRRNDWQSAGRVTNAAELVQDSNPHDKRDGPLQRDVLPDGRAVYRTHPHYGLSQTGECIPSVAYEKRFGMADPWSDEYKAQFGVMEDGNVIDVLAWILKGE